MTPSSPANGKKHRSEGMLECPYLLHALSPLHAGVGQTPGVIDLPIARMKATGIPFVPGSSIKGRLRQARASDDLGKALGGPELRAVFGPDTRYRDDDQSAGGDAGQHDTHAGALIVGDARLLVLPVRSFLGTFAWVTSPLLLDLAARSLGDLGGLGIPRFAATHSSNAPRALAPASFASQLVHSANNGMVYLDDLDIRVDTDERVDVWADRLAKLIWDNDEDTMRSRFLVVDDETMTYLWETATQVDTRVRLDRETRTVAPGALWTEESLPPETILIGTLAAERSRYSKVSAAPQDILEYAVPSWKEPTLTFGGKATVGRGRCRMIKWDLESRGEEGTC